MDKWETIPNVGEVYEKERRKTMKVVKFFTKNCGVCQMLDNVLNQINDLPEVEIIDCEEQPELAGEFEVYQVPTIVLLDDNNREVKRHTGFMPKPQFEKWVKCDE